MATDDEQQLALVPEIIDASGRPNLNKVRDYIAAKAAAYEASDPELAKYLKLRLTEISFTGSTPQEQAWAIGQLVNLVKSSQKASSSGTQRLLSDETRGVLDRLE